MCSRLVQTRRLVPRRPRPDFRGIPYGPGRPNRIQPAVGALRELSAPAKVTIRIQVPARTALTQGADVAPFRIPLPSIDDGGSSWLIPCLIDTRWEAG